MVVYFHSEQKFLIVANRSNCGTNHLLLSTTVQDIFSMRPFVTQLDHVVLSLNNPVQQFEFDMFFRNRLKYVHQQQR